MKDEENEDSRMDIPDNERYCDRFNGPNEVHRSRSSKAKRPRSRGQPYKAVPPPPFSTSMSEIKSELDTDNSFVNQDFNQQKQKDDNLIENINRYKNQLNTNIKLINKNGLGARVDSDVALRPSVPTSKVIEPARPFLRPKSDYRSEYNFIKIVAEKDPKIEEDNLIKEPKVPKKIELGPIKPGTESMYSGFSQHLQESRVEVPESKRTADEEKEEKKHSAFSSFN
ncbi:hypothetical protein L1887_62264 [Cichorium endivia]|nr:hypothetical protein L1887_62264 [Cichorium endivia]